MSDKWKWHFQPGWNAEALGGDPADLSGAKQVRDMEDERTVYFRGGFYFKLYHPRYSSFFRRLRERLLPQAGQEFRAILHLERCHLAVVEPVAYGVCGTSSLLITRAAENCCSVMEYLRARILQDEEIPEPFLLSWSRFLAKFVATGLYIPDLNCGNLLYNEDENRFVLVDPLGLKRNIRNRSNRVLRMLKRQFGAVFSCVPKPRILKMLAEFDPADPEGFYRRLLAYNAEYVRKSNLHHMKRLKEFRRGAFTVETDGIRIKIFVCEAPFLLDNTEKISLPPEQAAELWERDYIMGLYQLPLLRVVARNEQDGSLYRQIPGTGTVSEADREALWERLDLAGFRREEFDCCVNHAGLPVLRDCKFSGRRTDIAARTETDKKNPFPG